MVASIAIPSVVTDDVIRDALDASLKKWGRYRGSNWEALSPLVALGLEIVQQQAARLVEAEGLKRGITEEDQQRAAWIVTKQAIEYLRLNGDVGQAVHAALDGLPERPWPRDVRVPEELYDYVVLAGEYLWRWSVKEIAGVLFIAPRTVAEVRARGVRSAASRIAGWEMAWRYASHSSPAQFAAVGNMLQLDGAGAHR